jgi:hypothetical protein
VDGACGQAERHSGPAQDHEARAFLAAGQLDEAIRLSERTLADCERVLGAGHPLTQAMRENLAAAQRA